MAGTQALSAAPLAGASLLLGILVFAPGVAMFWLRGGMQGGSPRSRVRFVVERSFIMAAVVFTAIGLVLLGDSLDATGGRLLARAGATGYLFGGVLLVAGEALALTLGFDKILGLIVAYVVLACLSQAAIGGALLESGIVAGWIGWLAIAWNVGWLAALPLFSPHDPYYPFAHHLMPLVLGIALLLARS